MTDSNAEFVQSMKSFSGPEAIHADDFKRLIALAEERVMVEEHKISIGQPMGPDDDWCAWDCNDDETQTFDMNLSTAIRSVVAKLGETK